MTPPPVAITIFATLATFFALGCQPAVNDIAKVSIEELTELIAAGDVVVIDANSEGVRREVGVIPGARLLSHAMTYDLATELPEDKSAKLVFYCASAMCTAAPSAARRAAANGYRDVAVMPEGIRGWVQAHHRVDFPHLNLRG
jgi:rhodanese-related sulfurtransferase